MTTAPMHLKPHQRSCKHRPYLRTLLDATPKKIGFKLSFFFALFRMHIGKYLVQADVHVIK